MPRYPPKKQTHAETQEIIETRENKFLLTVRRSETSALIYIGGIDAYCLECQVSKKDNPIGNLSKIAYDEKCSLTGRFERGTDTIGILRLLFSYLQSEFPHVTHLTFDDFSTRDCSGTKSSRQTIDLACLTYLLTQKSWYMNRMDATFSDPKDYDKFMALDKDFQESKKETSWETFDVYVTTAHPLSAEVMKELYNSTGAWVEFFNALKGKVEDMTVLCEYMAPWITQFVKSVAKLRFTSYQFVMPVNNPKLPTIEFTVRAYAKGGLAFTRRYRKSRTAVDLR